MYLTATTDALTTPTRNSSYSVNGNTITWDPISISPSSTATKRYQVAVSGNARQSNQLTSNVSATTNGVNKASTKTVRVIEQLPVTGVFASSNSLLTVANRTAIPTKGGATIVFGILLLIGFFTGRRFIK